MRSGKGEVGSFGKGNWAAVTRRVVLALILTLVGLDGGFSAEPSTTVFLDVNVLPMEKDGVLERQDVTVKDGRIVRVEPTGSSPHEGAAVIKAPGKFLMPGLTEMHGHIPSASEDPGYIEDVLFLYLANGVTTVRGMLGWPGQLDLRERAKRGELLSPTLYLAGPSFNGNSIHSPQEAIDRVRLQKEEGWDLLKVHPGLSLEEYDAMADTADRLGIHFAGHIPADVGLLHALERRQLTIDHLDGYVEYLTAGHEEIQVSDEQLRDVAKRTLEAGVSVVPTMALWETVLGAADLEKMSAYRELRLMPARIVKQWKESYRQRQAASEITPEKARQIAEVRKRLLKVLNDTGVPVLLGTDAPQLFSVPGFSIHREVKLMRESGLTTTEILRSGTVNVARHFSAVDKFGIVAPGYRADFLVLEGNPLDDLSNLQRRVGVMVKGKWIPESEIQVRLTRIGEKGE